jgi:nicotinate-nucleotide adenylyltransferase
VGSRQTLWHPPPHPGPLRPRGRRGGSASRRRRIGLLGGSFNPAHGGHLHISRIALQRLDLDEVWWLVSPQNPLKPSAGMAPFAQRLAGARQLAAQDKRIRVTDIEARLGSRYTVDTLKRLRRRFPRLDFIWLMGADNLLQISRWCGWIEIFRTVPIAVIARPSYSLRALAGIAAIRFARRRVPEQSARHLAAMRPPAWVFFHTRLDIRSATQIRAERQRSLIETCKEQRPELPALVARSPVAAPAQPALLDVILHTLEDGKAEDIVTIDLAGKTVIADQMVIATGHSARQVAALTEHLEQALAHRTRTPIAIEGKAQADWVLIDAGDVIVHLFRPEVRSYYNLEKMWGGDFAEAEAARG